MAVSTLSFSVEVLLTLVFDKINVSVKGITIPIIIQIK